MRRYAISRLLLAVPTLLGVSILVFSILHLIPGDPVLFLVRESGSAVDIELIREEMGFNDPLPVQYWRFLTRALRGDLGQGLIVKRPVTKQILSELPYTLRLAGLAWVLTVFFGLFFGIVAALNVDSWLDSVTMFTAISGLSIPNFWMGLLLILIFCVKLGWLPILGSESLKVMILPAFALGFRGSAVFARMTRSGLLEVLGEDYIRTARAKGLAERVVLTRHALKNALIPLVTIMGLRFGHLLGGAVIIETVFARRGIGFLAVHAILQRDYPLAQGTVFFAAVGYVLVNIIVDLAYGYIDPRIRYE